ncbi:MAG TPA: hypothetical protein VM261_32075 [Kofleriaceae bacterium]|nr:hypothetical protein [Kofleriaceae bacterium]
MVEGDKTAYVLDHMSNEKLLRELGSLVAADREATALLLAHLGEVDARTLYRPLAYSTMHEYCVCALRMSEDSAYKRVRAARAARRFPQLFDAIADGRLHLSGVAVLAPHLTDENVDALIAEATHRRKRDIEIIAARLAPRPDVPDAILPLSPAAETAPGDGARESAPGPNGDPPARVLPLAPERFGLQVTIDQETRDKLERAKALMRHRNPSGDLAVVLDAALDALLTKLEKQKFGATDLPRPAKARSANADPTYIPAEVRRAVYERDKGQCTFSSADGMRCTERGFLELDHSTTVCRGGQPTVEGLRLRCHAHNQYAAEQALGEDFMRAKRAAAARDRDVTRALRGLGFKADETNRAMSSTAQAAAATFEERLRVALAELTPKRGSRCSEGSRDAASLWTTAFEPPLYALEPVTFTAAGY